ncbi:hypothetical protein SARC_06494 [Sphaeroforma arctica JP610]|uniref:TRAM domain-containing protein n=1 Tax=Sphaeroforma arctica JP610 TaxID=667725 RepID=A0A0L0FWG4_9EUKA|nr:hypothetical protein SARC_06494 [Sphaeroforma arctica JP610]KNC81170.1 hypothetical protein SARC_06494 [Sphaeroforma arctica JP610]|eukprot:XP_014155072.1 hypothetical protein SARC_06494 [Sphaeroforma arctica JP610]
MSMRSIFSLSRGCISQGNHLKVSAALSSPNVHTISSGYVHTHIATIPVTRSCIDAAMCRYKPSYRHIHALAATTTFAHTSMDKSRRRYTTDANVENVEVHIKPTTVDDLTVRKKLLHNAPSFKEFLSVNSIKADELSNDALIPAKDYLPTEVLQGDARKVFFETYGCQMNVSDTEVVWAILKGVGYEHFKTIYKTKKGGARFADLLDAVSLVDPDMRIRFTSPHPKDFPEELIELISTRDNICNHIHLPAQSGNSEVLQRMRRGYSREAYLTLAAHLRQMLPGVHISSDFITGFCGETEDEHTDTLTLMAQVKYEQAFLFAYSMREKTHAHRRFKDDVAEDVKQRRLREIIDVFRSGSLARNEQLVGTTQLVLVDSIGRKPGQFLGRTDGFTRVIMSDVKVPSDTTGVSNTQIEVGDYVAVHITEANAQTLRATPLRVTNIVTHAARAKSKALGDASSDCDSDSSALSG